MIEYEFDLFNEQMTIKESYICSAEKTKLIHRPIMFSNTFFRTLLALLLISVSTFLEIAPSFAQNKYTISGTVTDAANGETMIGTNVFVEPLMKGATTNVYGFYSLTLPEGKYTLKVSFLGFETYAQEIDLAKDLTIDLELKESAYTKEEVVVRGEKKDENTKSTKMSTVEIPIQQVKELPALMGEVDIIKIIQLMPGVKSGSEGNSGLYVRGGGPDQNLVLLDEAVVYNASHLFGFLSVFNSDAIKGMELIKGGMPAKYGGRLAAVLDISMKEGNNKKFEVEGGIGVINSRLTLQGPIVKDKGSFIVSGRFAYAGLLGGAIANAATNDNDNGNGGGFFAGASYYFFDVNAKVNYTLGPKDRIFASGYFGRDVFGFKSQDDFTANIAWGNGTGALRWNHIFNPKMFMNTSLIFSDYTFEFGAGQQEFELKLQSGIRDFNLKLDLSWMPDIRHNVQYGANYIYHTFTPSSVSARTGDTELDLGGVIRYHAHEAAVYIQDDWDISDRFRINVGIRGSLFAHTGPFDRYIQNEVGQVVDTTRYGTLENVKTYGIAEPRVSGRVMLGKHNSIKASYTMNYQYIHLASLASISFPTDLWMPSTDKVKPQEGHQWALGYFHNFLDDKLEVSVEGYYKTMKNLIEYRDGFSPDQNINNNPDNNFVFGKGNSYGAEFFIRKNGKKFTGWIGYTLAWTNRKFEALNNGNWFPATYDRRHDLSIVGSYRINERWSVSAIFVYGTGSAMTVPASRYFINGNIVTEYGDRNSFRMPDYHRLDLGATLHPNPNKNKRFKSTWNFGIYNVYSRQNPYFVYFASKVNDTDQTIKIEARQVSVFPILPSVTWNFKF